MLDIKLLKMKLRQNLRGVHVRSLQAGDGVTYPKSGDEISVHYIGRLASSGKVFDSTLLIELLTLCYDLCS